MRSGHKKKIISVLIMTVLMVLTLASCGTEDKTPGSKVTPPEPPEQTASDEEAEEPVKTMYVTSEEGLMFRKGPGTDQEAIGCLNFGEEIQVEKIEEGWAYTTVGGQSGWCYAKYLTENKDEIESSTKENGSFKESILGIWQTEDGDFSYEILGDGTLIVRSQYGEDTCKWSADGNGVVFIYSDDSVMGYIYNAEKDILVSTLDESSHLVRVDSY